MLETTPSASPTRKQEQLLIAALSEPERAVAAWRAWSSGSARESIDPGSRRLLPLAASNLRRAGVSASELEAASTERRRAFVATELRLRQAAPLLAAFAAQRIDTIVLKGAALAHLYYDDVGLRPMTDVDFLVRAHDRDRAIALMLDEGFLPRHRLPPRRASLLHGENFTNTAGVEADLHWKLFPSRAADSGDPGWWLRSVPFEIDGAQLVALGASDQLVHILGHGLVWSPTPGHRWVADAAMILRSQNRPIDADEIVAIARTARMTPAVLDGLELIERLALAPIPGGLLERLRQVPVSRIDRAEHAMAQRRTSYTVAGELPLYAIRYARHARRNGQWATPVGLVRYVRDLWGLDDSAQVVRRIARRSADRLAASWTSRPPAPL